MSTPKPTSYRHRRSRDVRELVWDVIQREGADVFNEILQKHMEKPEAGTPPSPVSLRSKAGRALKKLVSEAKSRGLAETSHKHWQQAVDSTRRRLEEAKALPDRFQRSLSQTRQFYRELPTPVDRTKFAALLALAPASFLSGFSLGGGIPDLDVRFFPQGKASNAITVHSAPHFSVEISIEWARRMLERARRHPELTSTHRRDLQGLEKLFTQLQEGFELGMSARRKLKNILPVRSWRRRKERAVSLDSPTYQMAEAIFAQLVGSSRRR